MYESASRMKLDDRTLQVFPIQMGVYFGGGNAFVAQHFLYSSEIGAAFDEMGCKRMPQRMRADHFLYPGELCQLFDHHKNINPAQPRSSAI